MAENFRALSNSLLKKLLPIRKGSYPEVAGWIRSRLSLAILRATNLCLRCSRTKWRSGAAMNDGAGLPELEH